MKVFLTGHPSLHLKSLLLSLSALLLACHAGRPRTDRAGPSATLATERRAPSPQLVGVWRVVSYCRTDSAGRFFEPFGPSPAGYFVYAPTGQLSIQVTRTPALAPFAAGDDAPTDAERRALLGAYFGYFGTYTITTDSTVVHHVEGGTIPSYIGTNQFRRYRIAGDTLSIGDVAYRCRVLLRVR
ncbi:MAG: lipocalin-like domain-containing protein [Gemmatimonadaceae bacterium]